MKRTIAYEICNLIEVASTEQIIRYSILRTDDNGQPLTGFHEWVDYKEIVSTFLIKSDRDEQYYFLFIDWQEKDNFYLVIYPKNKTGPIAEIHLIEAKFNTSDLYWRYKPTKQDGRNAERIKYFRKHFLDNEVRIQVPQTENDIEIFLDELFSLAENRLKADQLAELEPNYRQAFPEGRSFERMHKQRERNSRVIEITKKNAIQTYGKLMCEICMFDFQKVYGDIGKDFIEAHHIIPVSELNNESVTYAKDIVLVCSNCHSMLHRKRPWPTLKQMKELVKRD